MTLTQFKKMKPKYQLRIVVAGIIAVILFIALLLGISALFSGIRTTLNTKNLSGVTSANVLHQSTFSQIMKIADQDDPEKIFVVDSRIVYNDQGVVSEFDMNFVNLVSSRESDHWLVHLKGDKSYMRLTTQENKNRSSLEYTKLTFAKYYPTLLLLNSPLFLQTLQKDLPVGKGGLYIFTDNFGDNLNPQFAAQIEQGLSGYKVASSGNSVGSLPETFVITPGSYVPFVISTRIANSKNPNRISLLPEEKKAVLLLGVTNYRIG